MRCKNCGWENQPNAAVCEKCNTPFSLSGVSAYNNGPSYNNGPTYREPSDPTLRGTVKEGFDGQYPRQIGTNTNCPNCGYELPTGVNQCPNCGWNSLPVQDSGYMGDSSLKRTVREPGALEGVPYAPGENRVYEASKVKCPSCGDMVLATGKFCPNCGSSLSAKPNNNSGQKAGHQAFSGNRQGTVNPWAKQVMDHCSLTPIVISENGFEEGGSSIKYKGSSILLNRDNTDPENPSITSKEHAILSKENGEWFIENRSEMHTTMLLINNKRHLEPGDIIVLGNGLFRFEGER